MEREAAALDGDRSGPHGPSYSKVQCPAVPLLDRVRESHVSASARKVPSRPRCRGHTQAQRSEPRPGRSPDSHSKVCIQLCSLTLGRPRAVDRRPSTQRPGLQGASTPCWPFEAAETSSCFSAGSSSVDHAWVLPSRRTPTRPEPCHLGPSSPPPTVPEAATEGLWSDGPRASGWLLNWKQSIEKEFLQK